jgi:hypothetical protein
MPKRNQSAARRDSVEPEPPTMLVEPVAVALAPPVAPDAVEEAFFRRGDAGMFEPPVYLPYESFLVPMIGVLLLVGLSVVVLL